jgi:hypothetical protein
MIAKQFKSEFSKVIITASKFKTVMLKRNLKIAKAVCPHCNGGFLHGRIQGNKNHFHMACDKCDIRFME